MKKNPTVSILVPVYKGSLYLKDALESVYRQQYPFYELRVVDDNAASDVDEIARTKKIVSQFKDTRIRYIKNEKNLGSQSTIKKLASQATGDILYYLCQDDILSIDALHRTVEAFSLDEDIGAVTRAYFWFEDDSTKPVRAVYPVDRTNDTILSVFDGPEAIQAIFGSLGQLSGLAYRREWIETPFHTDVFPGHIYPFAGMLKKHRCVFLKNFTVAVRIKSSQSRNISSIYNVSPLESWVKMFNTVYNEKKFETVRKIGIESIATHYVGLVQIKNFGPPGTVIREIRLILKYHPKSLFDPKFWLYSLLVLATPRVILMRLTDYYKQKVLSKFITDIDFKYS